MDIWNNRWHDGCIFHYHTIIKTNTFFLKACSLFSSNYLYIPLNTRVLVLVTPGSKDRADGDQNRA